MSDLAREIAENVWTEPFGVGLPDDGVATLADVIKEVISNRRPGTKFRFSKPRISPMDYWGNLSFAFGLKVDNNPWEDAEGLAQDVDMRLYFDGEVCVLDYDDDEIDRLARIDELKRQAAYWEQVAAGQDYEPEYETWLSVARRMRDRIVDLEGQA